MSEVETELQQEVEQTDKPEIDVQALLEERERLLKHNETLLAEKKAKQEQARQAQLERERLEQEKLKANGDIEKLEKAWQEKIQTYEQKLQDLEAEREKDLVKREAQKVISKLTVDPRKQKLLNPFVEPNAVVRDGRVWFKNEDGQPVLTLDEYASIMRASSDFDVLIDATRASGTGASGQAGIPSKSPTEMTEQERLELKRSNPEQFKKLFNI